MIYAEEHELEAILASSRVKCVVCTEQIASWRVELREDGQKAAMCGWCVMYSGKSHWGHENRGELAEIGTLAKVTAEKTRSKRTHIPKLDERHRFNRLDSEKFLMGVAFTSRILRSKLRRVADIHMKSDPE